jgi:hypothetical protein
MRISFKAAVWGSSLTAFALTVGIRLWLQSEAGEAPRFEGLRHAVGSAIASAERGIASAVELLPGGHDRPPDARLQDPPAADADALAAATEEDGAALRDPGYLPVNVMLSRDPGSGLVRVSVHNDGDTALDLSVASMAQNGSSNSQVEVTVRPGDTADLSAAGLLVNAGDHVRFRSPPFLDLDQPVQ